MADFMRNYGFSRDEWNDLFTRSLLGREEVMLSKLVERVSSTVLVSDVEDKFCWAHDRNGEFSVRKYFELLIMDGGEDTNFAFDKIWKLKVPPRVQSSLWMLATDRIPTEEFLVKRGVNLQNISISCPWSERVPESENHLFFKCKFIEGFGLKYSIGGRLVGNRVGCGAVLRDKERVVRALFSSFVAADDTDLVEIGAVMVALEAFLAIKWKLNDSLFIELGSIGVFYWCFIDETMVSSSNFRRY
ncbi:hypothetical protein Gogos_020805 [Gossypium gossypioides]|uniref:Reverse transcriptase zinc-binding domain-containing protein n=1 Tax=Gossypium gossypioides TaxID=34282 RepID=A0A7J9CX99_GOSGO|nr:hypothetical protein [Gossypium gossypioides]